MSNIEASILPQEIVNLIVDEVASQNSPKTLRSCALVSRLFSSPSCRQLFSEIEIIIDETVQPRAKRLLKVLKHGQNVNLMAFIQSLKVVLTPQQRQPASSPSNFNYPLQKSKQMATSIAKHFPHENYLLKLLSLFVYVPLTSFTLDGRKGYAIWKWPDERTNEVVRQLCTNSSLKSLRISKIYNFDMTLIGEILRANTLQEFSVIAVSQYFSAGNIAVDNHAEVSSRIEKLDIRRLSYPGIFRILGCSTGPLLPGPYPFVSFLCFHTLVITTSSLDSTVSMIWGFILGVAGTLESLEIEELGRQGEYVDNKHCLPYPSDTPPTFRTYSA